jgi:3-isopropylmalate dehydrogenase
MKKKIALAPGDGIGHEVVREGKKILKAIAEYTDYNFEMPETPLGGQVWKETGTNLPEKSLRTIKESDAVLFGGIGLPDIPPGVAETAILKLRQGLDLFINLRPVKLFEPLTDICPLRSEYFPSGIDIHIIRENTEGLYAKIGGVVNNESATNIMVYTRKAVERIIKYAFEYATNKKHTEIISVDKANMLACSQFWRENFSKIGRLYPDLKQTNFYVDAFCQWLLRSPSTVQTVVTENMFGDIISDEAAYLSGSLGMAASGNIHPGKVSVYEPIHGSAPDIAGQNIANPIGAILSVKMMFEESFHDTHIPELIEAAVVEALWGFRTIDIYPCQTPDSPLKKCATSEMGSVIADNLIKLLKS